MLTLNLLSSSHIILGSVSIIRYFRDILRYIINLIIDIKVFDVKVFDIKVFDIKVFDVIVLEIEIYLIKIHFIM